jgi:hypothetical protein
VGKRGAEADRSGRESRCRDAGRGDWSEGGWNAAGPMVEEDAEGGVCTHEGAGGRKLKCRPSFCLDFVLFSSRDRDREKQGLWIHYDRVRGLPQNFQVVVRFVENLWSFQ